MSLLCRIPKTFSVNVHVHHQIELIMAQLLSALHVLRSHVLLPHQQ